MIEFAKTHSTTRVVVGPDRLFFTPMWNRTPIKPPPKSQTALIETKQYRAPPIHLIKTFKVVIG